jgi:hypothetical protein
VAYTMKAATAPKRPGTAMVIAVDPLKVASGHRSLPRGGAHASARRPSRAKAKRQMRRQLADGGCRDGTHRAARLT